MFIDVHTHAYQEHDLMSIMDRTRLLDGSLDEQNPNKWSLKHSGDIQGLLEAEQKAGIDRFVLLPITRVQQKLRQINTWAYELSRVYTQIIPFATLLPLPYMDLKKEVEYIVSLGIRGVKIHPFLQQISIRSKDMMMIAEFLSRNDLILLIDTMNMEGLGYYKPHLASLALDFMHFSVESKAIADLAVQFTSLKIIAAHLGCLYKWDDLDLLYGLQNVYFDTSFISPILPRDKVMEIIERKGIEFILFGTDAPWRHPLEVSEWLAQLPLSEEERDMIKGRNFLRLLGSWEKE